MKVKNIISVFAIFCIAINFCFSDEFTFTLSDGSTYIVNNGSGSGITLPQDVFDLVIQNNEEIQDALIDNNVTQSDLDSAVNEITNVYNDMSNDLGFIYSPLSTTINGLNNFSEDLTYSIANAQLMQNVWAEAWIGKLTKGAHMGFGVNLGASKLEFGSLKKAAKALDIDFLEDFPDFLGFPTVAADLRLGGIVLPFDIGVSFMTIDSTRISSLNDIIDPVKFDFFTLQFDFRWALLQGKHKAPKLSIGGGFVLTKGGVDIESDYANAELNFKNINIYGQAQISKKFLFFIPFLGVKLSYLKADTNWNAAAQWSNIMPGEEDKITMLQDWGILPTKFEGGYEGSSVIPQIFGGFCFDIFVINLTFLAGWDFKNKLFSGAFNFRIAW